MVEITGFVVGDEIGRGGFGVVYRARDLAFERDVAIKVLHDVPGTDLRQRFLAECRAVGSLDGRPGIPTVYSTGVTADGAPFMAMELLPGGSLSDRQPLPADVVVRVGRRLAEALQAAHAGGVIHRDVKPANVLFDAADQPVLVDFGISALVGDTTHSASADVAVSVAFAPPEVLAGGRPEVPGDVYALGATLFCALVGRAPFVSSYGYESIATIAARIATAQVEDLRPLGVPDGLARVIEIAMAKDPAARFATMADFGAALAAAERGDLVPAAAGGAGFAGAHPSPLGAGLGQPPAHRPGGPNRSRRPRRPVLVAAAVTAVLVAGGATAVALASGGSGGTPSAAAQRSTGGPGPAPGGDVSSSAPGVRITVSVAPDARRRSLGPAPSSPTPSSPAPSSPAPSSNATRGAHGGVRTSSPSGGGSGHGGGSRPGGTHSTTPTTPTSTPTAPSTPTPTPTSSAPNRRPTVSATGRTWDERASVSIRVTVADPDGDGVMLSAAKLPSWLHLSGHTISGVPPYNAASVTTTHTAIKARAFTLELTATDSHGATARTSVVVHVRDTLRTMPDYIGKTGSGSPSISAVSTPTKGCAYQRKGDGTRIYWQSIAPGTVIPWGRKVTYRYGRDRTSCTHVTGHWPT